MAGTLSRPEQEHDETMRRISAQTGQGFILAPGNLLTVVDPTGGQVSDLFCVDAQDPTDVLSSGRSIDYANKILFSTGDILYSARSRPMLTIVEDTCGRHDFLLTPCSQQTFDLLYPEFEGRPHPSCLENLRQGLEPLGVDQSRITTTFNIFMNVWWEPDGNLHIDPPTSRAGDRFVVRAERPLLVGLTACSAEKSNGGICKPIDYEITDR